MKLRFRNFWKSRPELPIAAPHGYLQPLKESPPLGETRQKNPERNLHCPASPNRTCPDFRKHGSNPLGLSASRARALRLGSWAFHRLFATFLQPLDPLNRLGLSPQTTASTSPHNSCAPIPRPSRQSSYKRTPGCRGWASFQLAVLRVRVQGWPGFGFVLGLGGLGWVPCRTRKAVHTGQAIGHTLDPAPR